MGFGIGGGKNKQSSNSNSNSTTNESGSSYFNDSVFADPQFNHMYGNLNNMWAQQYGNLGMGNPYMQQQGSMNLNAANFGQGVANYMGAGGSYGDTSGLRDSTFAAIQNSMNNPSETGRMYESIVGGKGNTYVDPLVASMRQSGNEALDRANAYNATDASAMGQSGSSRQAMENAMNTRLANQDMAGQEAAMRYGAYDKDLNWKMDIASAADAGRASAQERGLSALSGSDANRQAGMNFMPMQQNLNMGISAPWTMNQFMPFQMANMYSGAMGGPTVLSNGGSEYDGYNQTNSNSQSKGKGGSFNLGF